jgi:hypothetical protein
MTDPTLSQREPMLCKDDWEEPNAPASNGIFEEKYLLPEEAVPEFIRCAREYLAPDPYSDALLGDGYPVYSLYFDDAQFRTYYSSELARYPKYRIRRYTDESTLFLERKSKPEGKVRKYRTMITPAELTYLLSEPPKDWEGVWFHRRLKKQQMRPVCSVSYTRMARVGTIAGQNVRFTLDTEMRCAIADNLSAPAPLPEDALKLPVIIAEIKYERTLPEPFAELIARFELTAAVLSKYKRSVEALRLAPKSATHGDDHGKH